MPILLVFVASVVQLVVIMQDPGGRVAGLVLIGGMVSVAGGILLQCVVRD